MGKATMPPAFRPAETDGFEGSVALPFRKHLDPNRSLGLHGPNVGGADFDVEAAFAPPAAHS